MDNSISTSQKNNRSTLNTATNRALDGVSDNGLSIAQTSKRKVIDLTIPHDDEVILMPSMMLSDIACGIDGVNRHLDSVGHLLYLIYQRQITEPQAIAMASLAHDSVNTWSNLLYNQLEAIKEPLAQSAFGKVNAND
ncbi:hypothetical protein [Psychrobacter sp. 72-O-c]|uniref:hypothetical protein n=1 Tax=Psychrobacter sp. 72-O-c TaxID=2774125 RepID=UPI001917D2B4|nr:hypothetical protein [Psychrobacter sp. 72-O-c]